LQHFETPSFIPRMMIAARKLILLVALAGAALVGLVTNRFMAGVSGSPGQVKPAFAEPQQRADQPVAGESPALPLSVDERDGAYAAEGGENHRLTQERIMGWRRDGRVLAAADRESLLSFLGQGQLQGMTSGEWEERVNEILNLLRSQPGGVPGLAEAMMKMAEEDANPVLRMYALQHIAMWIPDEPSKDSREEMMGYLRKLSWSDNPLAGSAVLFLSDLERGGELPEGFVADGQIAATALRIASDPTAPPDVRIAALHACVDQGTATALPAARAIAADGSLMIPLRKAAIHTIGQFGTIEDRIFLEEMERRDPGLAAATKPALDKLGAQGN
jgi:hypothetical protein